MRLIYIATIASLVCAPELAHAGGFILNDHGAKATGRADAVVATVKDGSSIFYNPGGIGHAEGININIGSTVILPRVTFTDAQTGLETDAEKQTAITPNFYAYAAISDLVKVGMGFFTPFGSSTKWPASSPGADQTREATLRTFFFSPVVGFNLSEFVPGKLTVGGGFDVVPASVELARDIYFADATGSARLGGTALGFGGRIGLQYQPIANLDIGLAYRSKIALDFKGDGDIDIEPPYRSALPPDGDISAAANMPQSILGGIAYRPAPNLELEFNVHWIDWRSFDSLDIELADGSVTRDPRNWKAVATLRFGAEYQLPELGVAFRGGYAYDPTPIPSSTLGFSPPDADRHNISLGGSYKLPKNFWLDLGMLYGLPVSNTTSNEPFTPPVKGSFDIAFFVAALTIGYQFGGPADDAAPTASEPPSEDDAEPTESDAIDAAIESSEESATPVETGEPAEGADGEQTFEKAMTMMCDEATLKGAVADVPAAEKVAKLAEWLNDNITEDEARAVLESLASLDNPGKRKAVGDAAAKAGIEDCFLIRLWPDSPKK